MPRPYDTSYSPYAIGVSPFRVKGVLYQGTQEFFTETVRGGMSTLLGQIGPGPLAEFIGQKFLPASYYDALAIPALIAAESEACALSVRSYMLHRTKWQATRDIGGVYRLLLKVSSPETVAARLPRLGTQMFNFSKTETTLSPKCATTVLSEFPEVLVPWFEMAIGTYCRTALEMSGAKKPIAEITEQTVTGIDRGVRMVRLVFINSWE